MIPHAELVVPDWFCDVKPCKEWAEGERPECNKVPLSGLEVYKEQGSRNGCLFCLQGASCYDTTVNSENHISDALSSVKIIISHSLA